MDTAAAKPSISHTNSTPSANAQTDLAVQVERLLEKFAQSKKNERVLQLQVQSLSKERDLLKARIDAADQRVSTLLAKLST